MTHCDDQMPALLGWLLGLSLSTMMIGVAAMAAAMTRSMWKDDDE